jgi:hypothetical protein
MQAIVTGFASFMRTIESMKDVTPDSVGANATRDVSERSYLAMKKSGCSLTNNTTRRSSVCSIRFTIAPSSTTVVEFSRFVGGFENTTRQ